MTTQIRRQGGKAANDIKERQRIKKEEKQIRAELNGGRISGQGERPSFSPTGGEKACQPKEQTIKNAQLQAARKRAARSSKKGLPQSAGQAIRSMERGEKGIKTTRQTGQAIKYAGKRGICGVNQSGHDAGIRRAWE